MFSLSIADLCHHLALPEQDAKEMDFGLLSAGNPEIDLGESRLRTEKLSKRQDQ
jgi:hypothetical protein